LSTEVEVMVVQGSSSKGTGSSTGPSLKVLLEVVAVILLPKNYYSKIVLLL
jgi:hypothetical protein